jgi:cytochrome c biogenesis protein CcmG/thiol:disulfide interchange protein DsbE
MTARRNSTRTGSSRAAPTARQRRRSASRRARCAVTSAAAGLLLVGCSATTTPALVAPGASTAPSGAVRYESDPAEVAALRDAAGLAACPSVPAIAGDRGTDGDRLPDVALECLGAGPAVNLADLGGVPYVLNVWAGWCAECKDEMPYLQEVYEQAAGQVGVLGIDFQDTTTLGLSAAADFGVTFPSVQDTDGVTQTDLRFPGLPTTAFVTADGEVVATKIGPVESADELRDLIAQHLGVRL